MPPPGGGPPRDPIRLSERAGQFKGPGEGEKSRKVLRNWMVGIFLGLNVTTMGLLYWAHWNDVYLRPNAPPLVTSGVLMALIGATAVQVGSAMLMIVSFFFKGTPVVNEGESLE